MLSTVDTIPDRSSADERTKVRALGDRRRRVVVVVVVPVSSRLVRAGRQAKARVSYRVMWCWG